MYAPVLQLSIVGEPCGVSQRFLVDGSAGSSWAGNGGLLFARTLAEDCRAMAPRWAVNAALGFKKVNDYCGGSGVCSAVVFGVAPLRDAGCCGVALFRAVGRRTVRYSRILSRRFLPMPLTASRSSTPLNAPHDLRICKIFFAVDGPILGTCGSWSALAVSKLIGCGGFFIPRAGAVTTHKASRPARKERAAREDAAKER
jgi:hypothetical protein